MEAIYSIEAHILTNIHIRCVNHHLSHGFSMMKRRRKKKPEKKQERAEKDEVVLFDS